MHIILKVFLHLFFWTVYVFFSATVGFELQQGIGTLLQFIDVFVINAIWAAVAFYGAYLYAYEYFAKRQFIQYAVVASAGSLLLSVSFFLLHHILFYKLSDFLTISLFFQSLGGTFIISNCGSLLKGFISWFENIELQKWLEKENLKKELEALKSQINPHFLFNTLNNIDSLVYTNPEKASESIVTLSNILRYMMEDAKKEYIPIGTDLQHIENIVALHRIRVSNPSNIRTHFSIENNNIAIAPLLFTSFVENALKYADLGNDRIGIGLELSQDISAIRFQCKNSYDPISRALKYGGGFGIENTKRRLELLYPNRYELKISDKNNIFTVSLTIYI